MRWPSFKSKDNMIMTWALSNDLFKSDSALYLQQSLILPAPNHLEWEFCCVYNVWVCVPLQQSGPEPRGDSLELILLLCSSALSLQLCCKNPCGRLRLFDLHMCRRGGKKERWDSPIPMCGCLSSNGSCQIKDPKRATIPASLCASRCLCPWYPTMRPSIKLFKVLLLLEPSCSAQHQLTTSVRGCLRG